MNIVKRPWWLPEGISSGHILEAWDDEWRFRGSESRSEFSPVNLTSPVFVWDRELTNEEVMIVADALRRNDYQAVMDTGPTCPKVIDIDALQTIEDNLVWSVVKDNATDS